MLRGKRCKLFFSFFSFPSIDVLLCSIHLFSFDRIIYFPIGYSGTHFKIISFTFRVADSPLQPTIILLVENIAVALGSEFKIYLPQLIPQILRILMHDSRS